MFLIDAWTGKEPMAIYVGTTAKVVVWERAVKLVVKSVITEILTAGLSPEYVWDALARVVVAGADSYTQTAPMRPVGAFDAKLIFRRWIELLERSGRRKQCLATKEKKRMNERKEVE